MSLSSTSQRRMRGPPTGAPEARIEGSARRDGRGYGAGYSEAFGSTVRSESVNERIRNNA